ncbi:MAG: hypothetical protein GQ548_00995 [Methylophaga sp.]|nr:hypothetical protein [Methylophaga sp.]
MYKVLWLLGAYTEFVKLTSSRTNSKNRMQYFDDISGLCLNGGGFDEYTVLADNIDSLIELVDMNNENDIDAVATQIKALLLNIDWLPKAFRDSLNGKNYLPKNKLRWKLLNRDSGFMGKGLFRQHFFPNVTTIDLLASFLNEKLNYSTTSILKKADNLKKTFVNKVSAENS